MIIYSFQLQQNIIIIINMDFHLINLIKWKIKDWYEFYQACSLHCMCNLSDRNIKPPVILWNVQIIIRLQRKACKIIWNLSPVQWTYNVLFINDNIVCSCHSGYCQHSHSRGLWRGLIRPSTWSSMRATSACSVHTKVWSRSS